MPEPITVMHLRASNFVGGPEKQILEHLSRLDRNRFEPLLCTFGKEGCPDELYEVGKEKGISSFQLSGKSSFDLQQISRLRELMRQNNVKLLITHGYKANIIGYMAARQFQVPVIAYSHGWTGENKKVIFFEMLDRVFMKLIRRIVAVSDGHKKQIVDAGISEDKITVVHNAVSGPTQEKRNSIRERYSLPDTARIVISVGRLSPEKNFLGFIQAAKQILLKYEEVIFLVIGEGVERRRLEEQIVLSGLQGRFLLPGFSPDIPFLLPDAEIFVSSSDTEGLPVAVLEAAGAGLPVVATDVGGTAEAVHSDHNGILVQKGDMVALGHAIEHLLGNPEGARAMGIKGATLIKERFNFEAQTAKLEALYRDVLSENSTI